MNFISAFFERKRQAREAAEQREREWNERYFAERAREEQEEAARWAALTPEQQQAERQQEQLDRIEQKLRDIEWRQNYDPNDYDIV